MKRRRPEDGTNWTTAAATSPSKGKTNFPHRPPTNDHLTHDRTLQGGGVASSSSSSNVRQTSLLMSSGMPPLHNDENENDNNNADYEQLTTTTDPSDAVSFHRQLVRAIFQVGIVHASPAKIIDHMNLLPPFVKNEQIKSHLQRFRKGSDMETDTFLDEYDKFLKVLDGVEEHNQIPGAFGLIDWGQIVGGKVAALISHIVMRDDSVPPPGGGLRGSMYDDHDDDDDDENDDGGGESVSESMRQSQEKSQPDQTISSTILDHVFVHTETESGIQATRIRVPDLTMEEQETPLGSTFLFITGLLQYMEEYLVEGRRKAGLLPPKPLPPLPTHFEEGHTTDQAHIPKDRTTSLSFASAGGPTTFDSASSTGKLLTGVKRTHMRKRPRYLDQLVRLVEDLDEQNAVSVRREEKRSIHHHRDSDDSSSVTSSTSTIREFDVPATELGRLSPAGRWLFDNMPSEISLHGLLDRGDHGSRCSCCSSQSSILSLEFPFGMRTQSSVDLVREQILADGSRQQQQPSPPTRMEPPRKVREKPFEKQGERCKRRRRVLSQSSSSLINPSGPRVISDNSSRRNLLSSPTGSSLSRRSRDVGSSASQAEHVAGRDGYRQHLIQVATSSTTPDYSHNPHTNIRPVTDLPPPLVQPVMPAAQYGLHIHDRSASRMGNNIHHPSQGIQTASDVFRHASMIDLVGVRNLAPSQINQQPQPSSSSSSSVAQSTRMLIQQQQALLQHALMASFGGYGNVMPQLNTVPDNIPQMAMPSALSANAYSNVSFLNAALGMVQQPHQFQVPLQGNVNNVMPLAVGGTSVASIGSIPTYASLAPTEQAALLVSGTTLNHTVAMPPLPQGPPMATTASSQTNISRQQLPQQLPMEQRPTQVDGQEQQQSSQARRSSSLGLFFPVDGDVDGDDASI